MFNTVQQAMKIGDLRTKLLWTLGLLLIFRLGAYIPVPFIDPSALEKLLSGQLFGFFDIVSGGAFKRFSIFAMSITPYINASIIMQLLTVVIPKLEELSKEGDEGRKKIAEYTRYGTVVLGFIQAIGMSVALGRAGAVLEPGVANYLIIAISLTAGTAMLMWLGEMITEFGIGNGISLIIMAGIVSRLPSSAVGIGEFLTAGVVSYFSLLLVAVIVLAGIVAVVAMNEGQRRLPIQYAKRVVGRKVYGGQTTFLPLKVNAGGVIPIIFGMSILMFPATIGSWMPQDSAYNMFLNQWFNYGSVAYNLLYAALIIFFTFFYVAIIFNPLDVADNIKKNGGFVPGIRPGRPTAEYIDKILTRLTAAGGVFLAVIAVFPTIAISMTGLQNFAFGGTALLIVVGVALDTMKQVEAHLLLRSYEGFVK